MNFIVPSFLVLALWTAMVPLVARPETERPSLLRMRHPGGQKTRAIQSLSLEQLAKLFPQDGLRAGEKRHLHVYVAKRGQLFPKAETEEEVPGSEVEAMLTQSTEILIIEETINLKTGQVTSKNSYGNLKELDGGPKRHPMAKFLLEPMGSAMGMYVCLNRKEVTERLRPVLCEINDSGSGYFSYFGSLNFEAKARTRAFFVENLSDQGYLFTSRNEVDLLLRQVGGKRKDRQFFVGFTMSHALHAKGSEGMADFQFERLGFTLDGGVIFKFRRLREQRVAQLKADEKFQKRRRVYLPKTEIGLVFLVGPEVDVTLYKTSGSRPGKKHSFDLGGNGFLGLQIRF